MSLFLIASPIGNLEDISLRALKKLKETHFIIAEELKVTRRRLSAWNISPREKEIYQLNEHTTAEELKNLLEICKKNEVSLLTDCGTPSFFDPGFQLVQACREHNVPTTSLPGVSSLTALMPYLTKKTERFEVVGFPPRETNERLLFFKNLQNTARPLFFMDTPYRLEKFCSEVAKFFPKSDCVLGVSLTTEQEHIYYLKGEQLPLKLKGKNKENFVCFVYPK